MTLESVYNKSKAWYAEKYGNLKDCWQWKDEGIPYAIGDYIGSMGELTEADWEFARKENIGDECRWCLEQFEDDGEDN